MRTQTKTNQKYAKLGQLELGQPTGQATLLSCGKW
jgi:hypothetical protein